MFHLLAGGWKKQRRKPRVCILRDNTTITIITTDSRSFTRIQLKKNKYLMQPNLNHQNKIPIPHNIIQSISYLHPYIIVT